MGFALGTGVQTCALPIYRYRTRSNNEKLSTLRSLSIGALFDASCRAFVDPANRFLDEKSLIDLTPQHAEARRLKDLAMGRVYRWEIGRASCRERVCQYV